jgi:hypothetical protein
VQIDRPAGLAITAPLQSGDKIHLLNAIGDQRITHPETKATFDAIMGHVASGNGKRNNVVHDIWKFYAEQNKRVAIRRSARGALVEKEVPVTLNSLRAIASEIEKATLELGDFSPRGP